MLQHAFTKLLDIFSDACLREGMKYVQQDGLLSVRLSDGLLHARVKGGLGRLFDVYIDLKTWPKTTSRCTCETHANCEHAAASLLALRLRALETPKPSPGLEQLDQWIKTYQTFQPKILPPKSTHRLLYYVTFKEDAFSLQLAVGKKLKNGSIGKKNWLERIEQIKAFHQHDSDEGALRMLKQNVFDLSHLTSSDLLLALLKTEHVLDPELDLPWQLAAPLQAHISWIVDSHGKQHWVLKHKDLELEVCWIDKPWSLDYALLALSPIQLPLSGDAISFLLRTKEIALDQLSQTLSMMKTLPDLPLPFDLSNPLILSPRPTVMVILGSEISTFHPERRVGKIELVFLYQDIQVNASDISEYLYKQVGNQVYRLKRDFEFEHAFIKKCQQQLSFPLHGFDLNDETVLTHIQEHFTPWIEQEHGRVMLEDPVYAKLLNEDEIQWYGDLDTQGDFFAYELGILVEGKKVNLVPILIQLLSQYRPTEWEKFSPEHVFKLHIGHNQVLPIKIERVRPFIDFLLFEGEKYRSHEHAFKIKRYQWVVMQSALNALSASLRRQWSHDTLMKHLYQLVEQQALTTTTLPSSFKTTLRDYQQYGLDWLQTLRACGFGGILADDMGLGKTVQTLAHLLVEKESGRMTQPCLIIAPLSLIGNWQAEIERFTPTLKILIYHGAGRQAHEFEDYDLIISTYGLVQRDKTHFLKHTFYYLILDEAQWIKNARAQTTLMVQQLNASYRLCLSGTPFENHLGELWSLFHFIMPGLLLDRTRFRTYFQDPIEKEMDLNKKDGLMKRVQPFLLRRTKGQVARELPEKSVMITHVVLQNEQRDLYELIRLSMEKRVRESIAQYGLVKSQMVFLDALLKLRQVCCDPRLVSIPAARRAHGVSAKLDTLMSLLDTFVNEDRRILVFSQFTSMLALIEERIKEKGYDYLKLTGQTQDRQQLVNEFQKGETPIFLMSLKAGGVGLNLTQADTVIHYDPWWNPAVEDQATDRTHRLGQLNPVFVYRLVAEGTVEEVMMRMQAKKRALFEGILSEQHISGVKITEEDLAMFFQPLV